MRSGRKREKGRKDVFCGDVAVSGRYENLNYKFDFADGRQALFVNLEGALCDRETASMLVQKRKVFNIDTVIELLRLNHTTGCILANNHITDFDDHGLTLQKLDAAGIRHTGYGRSSSEAASPICFTESGVEYSLLAFGWNVAGCRYASAAKRGVNAMEADQVVQQVRRETEKGNKVIGVFHWNYTYEAYPMPAQRELAKMAVDAGASLIVGCHPHCIQGMEYYKGTPIVYSLGNWIFDNGVYFDGRLKTKELGMEELVVEYSGSDLLCHWYRFDAGRSVPVHTGSERAQASDKIKKMTPFAGMDDAAYAKWFKANRRVHKLTPVFVSNRHKVRNKLYYLYIAGREKTTRKIRDDIRWLTKKAFT